MHVIARLNVGGAALHVLQLAHEQERRGHQVVVVAGTLAEGEESMEYVADELGVGVLKLPALQRPLSVRADTSAILQLRELIRQRRPDVLHTHTAKAGATGRLGALVAGRARPRAVVHTYHGHVLSGYFSRRWERVFRRIEAAARARDGTARRGQRRGPGRSRRLRRRARRTLHRRPVRVRPPRVGPCRTKPRASRLAASSGSRTTRSRSDGRGG